MASRCLGPRSPHHKPFAFSDVLIPVAFFFLVTLCKLSRSTRVASLACRTRQSESVFFLLKPCVCVCVCDVVEDVCTIQDILWSDTIVGWSGDDFL